MEQKSSSNKYGVSFLGLLTIAFIVLKLTHVINWSWIWVLAPLWIPIALIILIAVVFIVFHKIEQNL